MFGSETMVKIAHCRNRPIPAELWERIVILETIAGIPVSIFHEREQRPRWGLLGGDTPHLPNSVPITGIPEMQKAPYHRGF